MKNPFLTIIILFFALLSCNNVEDETSDNSENNGETKTVNQENKNIKKVEVLFEATTFEDDKSLKLLRELGIGMCNPAEKDLENYLRPACNAKFFKLFPLNDSTPMENAFVLLIKSKVHGFPIRRTLIFMREKGKLVKINAFAANVIEFRKSKNKFNDLILRFSDEDFNHFNCRYLWRSNHFEFDQVEQINDADVKKEFQDSMNLEILKLIDTKGLQNL